MPKQDQAAKRESIAQWDALLVRYPPGQRLDLVRSGFFVLAANAWLFQLVANGRLRPFHLVLMVAVEAALLVGLAQIQSKLVPATALMEKPQPLRERLFLLGFALFWLGGVYGLVLIGMMGQWPAIRDFFAAPTQALLAAGLLGPLAVTAVGALADAVRDHLHWKSHGGYFLSTPGFGGAARVLTLFFGGIPFAVPIFAVGWAVVALVEALRRRGRTSATQPDSDPLLQVPIAVPILVLALLGGGLFALYRYLDAAQVSFWAAGYCLAKVASELLIVCIPWIAVRARAEESAALGDAKSTSPAPKRQR